MTQPRWMRMPLDANEPTKREIGAAYALQRPGTAAERQAARDRMPPALRQLAGEIEAQADAASLPKRQVRNTKHEASEQIRLTDFVRTRWYAPGYRHVEQARPSENKAKMAAMKRAGVRPGVPDVTQRIPPRKVRIPIGRGEFGGTVLWPITLAALELKAPYLRPRTAVEPEWWLAWAREQPREGTTRYGLQAAQAIELAILDMCDYRTFVAYGAEEAIAWLDDVAGPEPAEPIDWPTYGDIAPMSA